MLTEAAIKSTLKKVPESGKTYIELRDGDTTERGAGRLALFIRVVEKRITSEWYAVWFRDGRRRKTKIGTYPATSIADARKTFRETMMPTISSGGDPTGPRARRDKTGVTVKDLFEAYVASLRAAGAVSVRDVERALLGPNGDGGAAYEIGATRRAGDLKPDDITPGLTRIYERGSAAMAAAMRGYIGAAFGFALKSANDYRNPGAAKDWGITSNPILAIPSDQLARKPGDRHLAPAEFRAFWKWLETRDSVSQAAPVARILMATGQRVSEIMRIDDPSYDRVERIIDWARTKSGWKTADGNPHAIPLPRQAVAILDTLPISAQGLFFPSRTDPKKPMKVDSVLGQIEEFIRQTGAQPFVARDIRRTWKTLTGQAGIDKGARDRIQNHALGDVGSKHYDRWDYMREKRAAMAVWEVFLDRILAGEFDN